MHTEAELRGQQVVLVPSSPDHVETYHRWMTDPQLLRDTGTDALTLEQVYEMEKHWREDHDSKSHGGLAGAGFISTELTLIILANGAGDTASLPMVGDVNIFLKGDPSDEDFEAEVGVMIAERDYRGRGLAFEALGLMLSYVTGIPGSTPSLVATPPPFPIRPESLVVRVHQDNVSSIGLFERLGFVETKGANAFGEKEMRILGSVF